MKKKKFKWLYNECSTLKSYRSIKIHINVNNYLDISSVAIISYFYVLNS